MFRRRSRRGPAALTAGAGADWLAASRLRQLFAGDLEDGEQPRHACELTVTSEKFDRPATGWAMVTDRALRIRWGLATSVRQSLHVGYDRMRWVEVPVCEPQACYLTYFDAARPTAGWYQELHLAAASPELTRALPDLVSRYHVAAATREMAAAVETIEAAREVIRLGGVASPQTVPTRPAAGARRRRRQRLVRG